jgi:hypothetical protein
MSKDLLKHLRISQRHMTYNLLIIFRFARLSTIGICTSESHKELKKREIKSKSQKLEEVLLSYNQNKK